MSYISISYNQPHKNKCNDINNFRFKVQWTKNAMVHVFVMLQWHWLVKSLSKIQRNDNKFLFDKSKKIEHRNI